MARGFGSFMLVLLGAFVGAVIDANLLGASGIFVMVAAVAVAAWVVVYYQKKNKEELEAEISLLKDKLDKPEQKDRAE